MAKYFKVSSRLIEVDSLLARNISKEIQYRLKKWTKVVNLLHQLTSKWRGNLAKWSTPSRWWAPNGGNRFEPKVDSGQGTWTSDWPARHHSVHHHHHDRTWRRGRWRRKGPVDSTPPYSRADTWSRAPNSHGPIEQNCCSRTCATRAKSTRGDRAEWRRWAGRGSPTVWCHCRERRRVWCSWECTWPRPMFDLAERNQSKRFEIDSIQNHWEHHHCPGRTTWTLVSVQSCSFQSTVDERTNERMNDWSERINTYITLLGRIDWRNRIEHSLLRIVEYFRKIVQTFGRALRAEKMMKRQKTCCSPTTNNRHQPQHKFPLPCIDSSVAERCPSNCRIQPNRICCQLFATKQNKKHQHKITKEINWTCPKWLASHDRSPTWNG